MSDIEITSYLGRLTGKTVSAQEVVRLSSPQRAALGSWLRRQGFAFSNAVLQRGAFTVASLLNEIADNAQVSPPPEASASKPVPSSDTGLRVGIDIEHISMLPDAVDYREHEFYRENYTPAEIAYCLQQSDSKTSLCGLWAAKEAVVKALGAPDKHSLRDVEIRHDAHGRPGFAGGQLSISHSGPVCVAVFISLSQPAAPAERPVERLPSPPVEAPQPRSLRARIINIARRRDVSRGAEHLRQS
jgi:phosphopantetheinyl transferase (holo-ACP synthase)